MTARDWDAILLESGTGASAKVAGAALPRRRLHAQPVFKTAVTCRAKLKQILVNEKRGAAYGVKMDKAVDILKAPLISRLGARCSGEAAEPGPHDGVRDIRVQRRGQARVEGTRHGQGAARADTRSIKELKVKSEEALTRKAETKQKKKAVKHKTGVKKCDLPHCVLCYYMFVLIVLCAACSTEAP